MTKQEISKKAKCHHWTATAIKASKCFDEKGSVDVEIWERMHEISKGNCHRLIGSHARAVLCNDDKWASLFLQDSFNVATAADHWVAIVRSTEENCVMHAVALECFCGGMFATKGVYALPSLLNSLNPVLQEIRER